ncbi:anthocyanin 3'-O-beta-glucosyltransferase [Brachypodium distachyon]|uniref:anthocyanin 3'-O-beta-glucosyltransferase n=1 Tax=Brachypodium distachyon TaxID=15368 RepID=UPI000D0CDE41|nr:anthocyanin 3'-O-beta-glucosyltransferase [Brachypodium distachyon]|eukprot:XP_024310837.1 anthocyanin 3'-O-beta-glucosyltransferase [Brachypodium distachyon]
MAAASEGGRRRRQQQRLRVFFLPFFARGHLIPMTDLACHMAAARPANVEATMVVTPANAAPIAATVARAAASGHAVRVLRYPFPDVGLGPGVECLGAAAAEDTWRVYRAVDLSRTAHESLLLEHRPDAVVADVAFWWATGIAADLGVPRLTFHPVGIFPQLVLNSLVAACSSIVYPGGPPLQVPLPGGKDHEQIAIPVAELPDFLVRDDDHLAANWGRIKASQLAGFGVVVNTFADLERPYHADLDARRAYLLRELALGLETSNHPFLWVLGQCQDSSFFPDQDWEERVSGRGMVLRGWAPQLEVLAHPSVGAFLTHCGWNSVLEAASAGVPVLTWPLVFEQFINERLVADVASFGSRVWGGGKRGVREEDAETVPAEAIARAVAGFMEDGGGERRREKARELALRASAAVGENGSSWRDIRRLIDDLMEARASSGVPCDQERQ